MCPGRAGEASNALGPAVGGAGGEGGVETGENRRHAGARIGEAGAVVRGAAGGEDAVEVVVGRDGARRDAVAEIPAVALVRDAGDIGVERRRRGGARLARSLGADRVGDPRGAAVGADHEAGADRR